MSKSKVEALRHAAMVLAANLPDDDQQAKVVQSLSVRLWEDARMLEQNDE